MTQIDIAALVADLTTKSAMINMGEKIAWGSETALMDQAAAALIAQDSELRRLQAEIARLRAAQADAGAVMVEAALQLPAYDSDGDPAGQFDHHIFVRRDKIRALSTLSPIASAARMLIPVFEEKHRAHMTAKGRNPANYGSAYSMAVRDLRALAEQEKADG